MHERIILLAKTCLIKDEENRGTEREKSISR